MEQSIWHLKNNRLSVLCQYTSFSCVYRYNCTTQQCHRYEALLMHGINRNLPRCRLVTRLKVKAFLTQAGVIFTMLYVTYTFIMYNGKCHESRRFIGRIVWTQMKLIYETLFYRSKRLIYGAEGNNALKEHHIINQQQKYDNINMHKLLHCTMIECDSSTECICWLIRCTSDQMLFVRATNFRRRLQGTCGINAFACLGTI